MGKRTESGRESKNGGRGRGERGKDEEGSVTIVL